jgi:hypothetical protein
MVCMCESRPTLTKVSGVMEGQISLPTMHPTSGLPLKLSRDTLSSGLKKRRNSNAPGQ